MFGKIYFYDGHTENVIDYHENPKFGEVIFKTKFGTYGYKTETDDKDFDLFNINKRWVFSWYRFYYYNEELETWLIADIERIEIYREVLPNA